MTTNSCESINAGLNRNCPPLRLKSTVFRKILGHKNHHLDRWGYIVNLNNLKDAKRKKTVTEKFEILHDLCESFDKFSASERKQNLFKYLGLFARRDPIPEDYHENLDEPDIPELVTV